ncbi:MAG: tetratricopeptide repeat protein [Deltaproteobacteria bacterium]
MYTKILFVVIIFILGFFLYLHIENPAVVTIVLSGQNTYTAPVTLFLFAAFFIGAALAVFNSLIVDAKRAWAGFMAGRARKVVIAAAEDYKKGVEAMNRGENQAARTLIEKAVQVKPDDPEMHIGLAETYLRENKSKEALKILEAGIVHNPDSSALLNVVARTALEAGEQGRAVAALETLISLDPKNTYALKKLRDIRIKDGRWREAALLQKTVVDCVKGDEARKRERRFLTGALFEAGVRCFEDGSLSEALVNVKEVLKLDTAFMPAHLLLGDILYKQGHTDGAVKVWEKAYLKHHNSLPVMLRLEDIYIAESEPQRILDRYKKEISSRPGDTNMRLLLARLYLRLEMVDNAIEELLQLYHEGEDSFYPQVLLGEAYLRRKQGTKAAVLFQSALGLDKDLSPPFSCASCGHVHREWEARCPECGEWNTMQVSVIAPKKAVF